MDDGESQATGRSAVPPASAWQRLQRVIWRVFSKRELVVLACFVVIFLGASAFSELFSDQVRRMMGGDAPLGMWPYLIILIVGEIALPGSTLPLLPVVTHLRGALPTSVATVVGWMASALLAFGLARLFGARVLRRYISAEQLDKIGQAIPPGHLFRAVFVFRLIFPVGLASYAIGLFTRMHWLPYTLGSALGLVPYAFLLVWTSTWPLGYRLLVEIIGIALTVAGYIWIRSRVVGRLRPPPVKK